MPDTKTPDPETKGFSEETCTRCGWVMGDVPLNCQNDDTPHHFPSQAKPLLGLATTGELLDELRTRIEMDYYVGGRGPGLHVR